MAEISIQEFGDKNHENSPSMLKEQQNSAGFVAVDIGGANSLLETEHMMQNPKCLKGNNRRVNRREKFSLSLPLCEFYSSFS